MGQNAVGFGAEGTGIESRNVSLHSGEDLCSVGDCAAKGTGCVAGSAVGAQDEGFALTDVFMKAVKIIYCVVFEDL